MGTNRRKGRDRRDTGPGPRCNEPREPRLAQAPGTGCSDRYNDHSGDNDARAEQSQAAEHVFHEADVEIERPNVEVPVQRVVVCPAHIDQNRDQQRRVRDDLSRDPSRQGGPSLDQGRRSIR